MPAIARAQNPRAIVAVQRVIRVAQPHQHHTRSARLHRHRAHAQARFRHPRHRRQVVGQRRKLHRARARGPSRLRQPQPATRRPHKQPVPCRIRRVKRQRRNPPAHQPIGGSRHPRRAHRRPGRARERLRPHSLGLRRCPRVPRCRHTPPRLKSPMRRNRRRRPHRPSCLRYPGQARRAQQGQSTATPTGSTLPTATPPELDPTRQPRPQTVPSLLWTRSGRLPQPPSVAGARNSPARLSPADTVAQARHSLYRARRQLSLGKMKQPCCVVFLFWKLAIV